MDAAAAFSQVTRLAPDNPRGWNNLAYALLQTGCPQQAKRAAACAVRRGSDDANYRDTFADINNLAHGADHRRCVPITCEE